MPNKLNVGWSDAYGFQVFDENYKTVVSVYFTDMCEAETKFERLEFLSVWIEIAKNSPELTEGK